MSNRLKTAVRASMVLALVIGFAACAKYPVVSYGGAPAPTAATTHTPGR